MIVVAVDTETFLLGPGAVAPKLVCMSLATRDAGLISSALYASGELDEIRMVAEDLLEDDNVTLVFHNAAFDLTVLADTFPHLIPAIFRKLEAGLVTDTAIREKLLNLSTHGKMDALVAPDGSSEPIKYALAELVLRYTGVDRRAEKVGEDIWRTSYQALDGMTADEFPDDARNYAIKDAIDTLEIYEFQERRVETARGPSSVQTAELRTGVAFALRLMTCWGFAIDQTKKAEIEAWLATELRPEKLELLLRTGILIPPQPAMPYANGAKDKDGNLKMKAPTKERVSKKKLEVLVERICAQHELEVKLTAGGNVSTDGEVLQRLAPLNETLAQYQHRQSLQKLVTTYLPQIDGADTVHPEFDVLKETGRTSSYASKLYPSCNIQQVDPRVRQCYVARPGQVLCSVDYSAIELVSLAQQTYSLFGYSVHRDRINEGVDLHAYLGAQLAWRLADFDASDDMDAYGRFLDTDPAFYKHWRTFAKPVGLGFPGGMGIETFVTMARASYGIQVNEAMAEQLRDIWFETYPEMRDYFDWVKAQLPDHNNLRRDPETGASSQLYAYLSPMGMYRVGATYCAAANGYALQTPTAEGAIAAVFEVSRACYDSSVGSELCGCRPVAFIHDEIIVEIPDDEKKHERAHQIADIMIAAMARIMPDVQVRAEPALMRSWDKSAEPVFDDQGRLAVWTPEKSDGDQKAKDQAA